MIRQWREDGDGGCSPEDVWDVGDWILVAFLAAVPIAIAIAVVQELT